MNKNVSFIFSYCVVLETLNRRSAGDAISRTRAIDVKQSKVTQYEIQVFKKLRLKCSQLMTMLICIWFLTNIDHCYRTSLYRVGLAKKAHSKCE